MAHDAPVDDAEGKRGCGVKPMLTQSFTSSGSASALWTMSTANGCA